MQIRFRRLDTICRTSSSVSRRPGAYMNGRELFSYETLLADHDSFLTVNPRITASKSRQEVLRRFLEIEIGCDDQPSYVVGGGTRHDDTSRSLQAKTKAPHLCLLALMICGRGTSNTILRNPELYKTTLDFKQGRPPHSQTATLLLRKHFPLFRNTIFKS